MNRDKVKASQSKLNNSKTGKISKLKTPKGVMPYAPVDVSYRSLERRATPPCVLGNAPLGNFEMILMFFKNIRLIEKNIRTFVDKHTVD